MTKVIGPAGAAPSALRRLGERSTPTTVALDACSRVPFSTHMLQLQYAGWGVVITVLVAQGAPFPPSYYCLGGLGHPLLRVLKQWATEQNILGLIIIGYGFEIDLSILVYHEECGLVIIWNNSDYSLFHSGYLLITWQKALTFHISLESVYVSDQSFLSVLVDTSGHHGLLDLGPPSPHHGVTIKREPLEHKPLLHNILSAQSHPAHLSLLTGHRTTAYTTNTNGKY